MCRGARRSAAQRGAARRSARRQVIPAMPSVWPSLAEPSLGPSLVRPDSLMGLARPGLAQSLRRADSAAAARPFFVGAPRRSLALSAMDQEAMLAVRNAWFDQNFGPPPGNKCEPPAACG